MATVASDASSFAAYCRYQRKYSKLKHRHHACAPEDAHSDMLRRSTQDGFSRETGHPLGAVWVPSFIDLVGDTPLLNLSDRLAPGLLQERNVTILGKLEMLNPGLSSESRTINGLLSEALEQGVLQKGMTIVYASRCSNYDSTLALFCARGGFKCVIIAPLSVKYKACDWQLIRVYGGKVMLSEDVLAEKARFLDSNDGKFFDLEQFEKRNPALAIPTILDESWEQTSGKITHLVAAEVSTRSRALKRSSFKAEIVCARMQTDESNEDNDSSAMLVREAEAIATCHALATTEGICTGIRSGTNVFAALQLASGLRDAVIVVTLPDIGLRHLDDIYSVEWLKEKKLYPVPPVTQLLGVENICSEVIPSSSGAFASFRLSSIIGETPLIDLTHFLEGQAAPGVRVLAKVEYFNPGFSIKDRIIRHIFNQAEREGKLRPGMTVVAASSGNTGAATAMICAARGYKCVITTSPKCSAEKMDTIKAYGAELVVSPPGAKEGSPNHYMMLATALAAENSDWFDVNQYDNHDNSAAHYSSLAPEIWKQTRGEVTHFVAAGSTGGTITGTSRFLKSKNKDLKTILADPVGSIFTNYFKTGEIGSGKKFLVEGVGKGSIPGVIDFDVIDQVCPVTDEEAFAMCWKLARKEGICAGGSAGLNLRAALDFAKTLPGPGVVVTVFPDSGVKYLSKVYNQNWLKTNGLKGVGDN